MKRALANALNIYGDIFRKYGLLGIFVAIYLTFVLVYQNVKWLFLLRKKEAVVDIHGSKMWLDYKSVGLDLSSSSIIKQLALDKTREVEATNEMLKILKKDDVVLEVGANIGYYALMAAKRIGSAGKVFAIEPEPANVSMLNKNVSLNNYGKNIEVFPYAVSDKDGTVSLEVSKFSNRHKLAGAATGDNVIDVKSVTIDSFLRDKPAPTLIRMDVEGAEVAVFRGAQRTLEKKTPMNIFMEVHPREIRGLGQDITALFKQLQGWGFEISALILFDRNIRRKVGFTKKAKITIDQLLTLDPIVNGDEAFELFLTRS